MTVAIFFRKLRRTVTTISRSDQITIIVRIENTGDNGSQRIFFRPGIIHTILCSCSDFRYSFGQSFTGSHDITCTVVLVRISQQGADLMFPKCLIECQQVLDQEIIFTITIFGHIGNRIITQTEIINILVRSIPFKGEVRRCIQAIFQSQRQFYLRIQIDISVVRIPGSAGQVLVQNTQRVRDICCIAIDFPITALLVGRIILL